MTGTTDTVIIGAGVIGVLSAHALAQRGHRVTVIDAAPAPAEICSRGNAGILAVGHAQAWAGPDAPAVMLRALVGRAPGVRLSRVMDPALWRWGMGFLAECSAARHATNSAKLQALARFSRDETRKIETDLGLAPALRHDGGLYLFRDAAQFASHAASLGAQDETGMEVLDPDGLMAREPALAAMSNQIAGGFYSPVDSVGDCNDFTRRAATRLVEDHGVRFHFATRVTGFARRNDRIVALRTDQGEIPADTVLLATGVETPALTRPLGVTPMIYPVKGYSGTWQIRDRARIPDLPFVDETELLAVARYDNRLRVTAIAEFAGHDRSLPEDRIAVLRDYVQRSFGTAVDPDSATYWAGLRPTTPSGPPYMGRIKRVANLWINAGHGQLGWTTSAGCAALIADAISGTKPRLAGVSSTARWLDAI